MNTVDIVVEVKVINNQTCDIILDDMIFEDLYIDLNSSTFKLPRITVDIPRSWRKKES